MRFSRYLRLERNIAASDTGGIIERWRYGRRLLEDDTATTPNGNLRHGVLAGLVEAGRKTGRKLSEREIQRRLQCARTYPSEPEIRQILADFETWDDLHHAGFPAVQVPLGADTEPFDARDPDEKRRDAARELARQSQEGSGQLALFDYFPGDRFSELSTLADLWKYATEMSEMTARYAERDNERFAYLERLTGAVAGDQDKTWAEAQAALDQAAQAT